MINSQLQVFTCVVDCGSFTKAAKKLYISPTAVMKQINALEKHLKITLLERTNQGIHLTTAGKSFYIDALFLIDYYQKAIDRAQQLADFYEKTICIGTSLLNPCKEFMDLWYRINDKFPGYELHIVPFEDQREDIVEEISALGKKFDFIIAACDSTRLLDRCNFYQLGQRKLCCAVPRSHRLAQKKQLELVDLYGERLLMVKRGDSPGNDQVRDLIETSHRQITITEMAYFYDMDVFNYCMHSGSVLLTLDIWSEVHPLLVTVPVNWEYTIPYGILYSSEPPKDISLIAKAIAKEKGVPH